MSNDLDDLNARLTQFRTKDQKLASAESDRQKDAENLNQGLRAGAELVSCTLGGGFIGWVLDGWLGSKPLCLIIFLLLGICAGFLNVYRLTQNSGQKPLHNGEKDGTKTPEK